MSYAILRIEKAKTMANVGSRAAHNMRQNPTAAPHADPAKRVLNRVLIGPSDAAGVVAAVEQKLASVPKFRKDAVRAVELLMTASPEFFDSAGPDKKKWTNWMRDSLAWLRQTWGAENVVSAVLHRDEATPHIQAFVVPIHDGKLRAAHWLDGPAKLSQLQDSFAVAMGRRACAGAKNIARRITPACASFTSWQTAFKRLFRLSKTSRQAFHRAACLGGSRLRIGVT